MQEKKDHQLSHVDERNNPSMVNVHGKNVTYREATARSQVELTAEIMEHLQDGDIVTKKGPVFQTAIIAGTMAVKKTPELIPMCHPLNIEGCKFDVKTEGLEVIIDCTCNISSKTGVEMEALTGASIAALTIYDMCKAMSHEIVIRETKLLKKSGGKSDFSTNS